MPRKKQPAKPAPKRKRAAKGKSSLRTPSPADPDKPWPLALERRKPVDMPALVRGQMQELHRLSRELMRAKEEQQRLISRELHDNLAQVLAAAINRLIVAKRKIVSDELREEFAGVRRDLQHALEILSALSRNLRPPLVDHFGLVAALEKHAEGFRARNGIALNLEAGAPSVHHLDNQQTTHLFRIVQEALHNVEKHSGASEVSITLHEEEEHLHVEISDNGRSFRVEQVFEAQREGHLGLLAMRERTEMLGGKFHIIASPESGTSVRASIPLPTPRQGKKS